MIGSNAIGRIPLIAILTVSEAENREEQFNITDQQIGF
jgi:hypothetical protein